MAKATRLVCTVLLLLTSPAGVETATVQDEVNELVWPTAARIYRYYFEQIPADTLMHAAVRGVFSALDPDCEYEFTATGQNLEEGFQTFHRIARAIDDSAYYQVGADTLARFALAGMLNILDPYSVFMEKRRLANFNINTKGHYGGLGFRIQSVYPDSVIAVWSLLHPETPAALAGVKSGDFILAIEDSTTRFMSVGDAADLMRGEPGTPVTLTLSRPGVPDPFELTIERKEVQIASVPHYALFPDSTGYINLDGFQFQKSGREVGKALVELKGRGMKRLIFDLRGNGGGYLQEAVNIADLFLPKNRLVVYTAGRAFKDTAWYETKRDAAFADHPLLVLVDQASASASEIVAGAIQDWDRGLILGAPTVGKGSVQQTLPIGDKAELKLTMAAYFTPSGRSIDKRMRKDSTLVGGTDRIFRTLELGRIVRGGGGITPDVPVDGRKRTDLFNQLSGWRSLDSQFFRFAREYPFLHPEMTESFRADAETLRQFREFAESRGFEYVSRAEAHLDRLEEMSQEEDYQKLQKPLRQLQKHIDRAEEGHWDKDEELLRWKLTHDILEKAFGMNAARAYDVTVDPAVLRARQLAANPQEYEKWFARAEIGLDEVEPTSDGP